MDKKGACVLVLDSLQDPGNIGTIVRTAEAAGFAGIITTKGTGDITSPKVVRTAAGSVLRMPVITDATSKEIKDMTDKAGMSLIGTVLKEASDYRTCDYPEKIALVIGNEGKGISKEMEEILDRKIYIPMEGKIESLNAAVAAGIIMYHIKKER